MLTPDPRALAASPVDAIIQVDEGARWLHLQSPVRTVAARTPHEVAGVLREIDDETRGSGYHAVGFLTYEAGRAFGLATRDDDGGLPLACFALFKSADVQEVPAPSPSSRFEVSDLLPSVEWPAFSAACERIRECLADGDTYQVNYTWRLQGRLDGDVSSFFANLVAAQHGRYSALLRLGGYSLCSASPELFFARQGSRILARPMKGTAPRGLTAADDEARARELQTSLKERAENVMVVDMVRNDLGRIAETGSIDVRRLFEVERYPTLWQMTSEVTGRVRVGLPEIFAAMYPSASITGAPKVRTMQIITELETGPRGVYTGTIGYVAPDGTAQFNVAIRTAVVDHASGRLAFGIGSGIVWDSDPAREYQECLLKAEVLRHHAPPPFDLLETLRWTPGPGFFLLERHLRRLESSARFFGIVCSLSDVRAALNLAVAGADGPSRVRLLVGTDGHVRTECTRLDLDDRVTPVSLATAPIDRTDVFLFHKTTNRLQYERAQQSVRGEALLWNDEGQVTESTTANLVVEIDGERVTPPVECGLLAGTFRAELLEQGLVREAPVTIDQLRQARRIWLVNSVREWRETVLVDPPDRADANR